MDNNSLNKNLYHLHQKLIKHLLEIKKLEGFEAAGAELETANMALLNALSILAEKTGNKALYITTDIKPVQKNGPAVLILDGDIADGLTHTITHNPEHSVNAAYALKGLTPLK